MQRVVDEAKGTAPGAARVALNKKQLSRERGLETILRTALEVMVRRGYRNMTIDQIAETSGYTKGAIYHYFASKEELLMAVLEMVEQDVITVEAPEPAGDGGATARLVRFLHAQGARAGERADSFLFLVTLAADLSNLGEPVGNKVDAIFDRLGGVLERIVLDGQQSGQFSRRVSALDLTRLYVSGFSGNVLSWHRSGRQEEIGRSQVRALRIAMLSMLDPTALDAPRRRAARP